MKTAVTVATITADLDRITAGAEASEQWGAAKGAVETKAKLHGLLVDRKEQGSPGDFAAQSADDVLALVRRELGEGAADAMTAALAQQDAQPAEVEQPTITETRDPDASLN